MLGSLFWNILNFFKGSLWQIKHKCQYFEWFLFGRVFISKVHYLESKLRVIIVKGRHSKWNMSVVIWKGHYAKHVVHYFKWSLFWINCISWVKWWDFELKQMGSNLNFKLGHITLHCWAWTFFLGGGRSRWKLWPSRWNKINSRDLHRIIQNRKYETSPLGPNSDWAKGILHTSFFFVTMFPNIVLINFKTKLHHECQTFLQISKEWCQSNRASCVLTKKASCVFRTLMQ